LPPTKRFCATSRLSTGNQEASVRSGGSGAEGLRDRDLIEAGLSEPAGWRAGYGDCGCAAWSETAM
jgi:hypothetical protein